jgi:intein/homing endonuclease
VENLYTKLSDEEYEILNNKIAQVTSTLSIDKEVAQRWIRKKKGVPIEVLKILYNKPFLKILGGRKIYAAKGKDGIIYPKELNAETAYLIGIICTDGHISKKRHHVQIAQKNEAFLRSVKDLMERNFSIALSRGKIDLDKKTGVYKLYFYSTPLIFIFSDLYGIPRENKGDFSIPTIVKSAPEICSAFLAGVFDGDGGIYVSDKEYFERPEIKLYSGSKKFIVELKDLLLKYGIYSTGPYFSTRVWQIKIARLAEVVKVCFMLFPYVLLERKREKIRKLLGQKAILDSIRVPPSEKIMVLFQEAYETFGSNKELVRYIQNNIAKVKFSTVKEWKRGRYPAPLRVILSLCKMLNKNPQSFLPASQSILLQIRTAEEGF